MKRILPALLLPLASLPAQASGGQVTLSQTQWGTLDNGQPIPVFTISNGHSQVDVTPQGARLVAWRVPDKTGQMGNVLVGPTRADQATGLMSVAGATIGRFANRIAQGHLEIDGRTWALPRNNKGNTLHGGSQGFNTKLWRTHTLRDGLRFSRLSPDGEMGFPGALAVSVTYRLIRRGKADELSITYRARTTRPTVLNLTNHAFFDLSSGHGLAQTSAYVAARNHAETVPQTGIPTGRIVAVHGQPWDFTEKHLFDAGHGMDVPLVLDRNAKAPVAVFSDTSSGRTMRVFTSEPAAQLFVPVTSGKVWAFCFETQHLPDATNQPTFFSTLLRPGKKFHSVTIYTIDVS